jgi:hypothetical protein
VEGAQHLGGKDGAAGASDGEDEAEIGGLGFGGVGHEAIIADMSRLCDAAGENRQRQRLEICVKKIPGGCGWASFVGILPLHFVQGQDDSKNKQLRRANTEILAFDYAQARMTTGWESAFDDAGRGCHSGLGGRGGLMGVHAEEGKDRLTDAVRQQDARGQRRKHRTYQYRRITHRNIPLLSPATP